MSERKLRYFDYDGGRRAGLYPEHALQALRSDEVMDAVEDIVAYYDARRGPTS